MNIMEDEEDELPVQHPLRSSTTIQKWRCVDVQSDSDECFDLREVIDDGSNSDSPSESNHGAKTKKVSIQFRSGCYSVTYTANHHRAKNVSRVLLVKNF